MKKILPVFLVMLLLSCPDGEECFENPNLEAPVYVTNVVIRDFISEPTFIGRNFFPNGTSILTFGNALNRFFSIRRFDQFGNPVNFWWNDQTPSPFNASLDRLFWPVQSGEMVSMHVAIFNNKQGNLGCIFQEAEVVESILDVRVNVVDGRVIGEQRVTQTNYKVPAGQYAVFEFPFVYSGPGEYLLNIDFSSDGLIETDTTDNNYSVQLKDLGQFQ